MTLIADRVAKTPARARTRGAKMKVLFILSSSNQMYSGVGRNVFEPAIRLREEIDYEFAIDDATERNTRIVEDFCAKNDFPLHLGLGIHVPNTLDILHEGAADLVKRGGWDAIECVCWANAATNGAVLEALEGRDVPLIYTPHYQPIWTVPMSDRDAENVSRVHLEMLRRASVVFCDSPWEFHELKSQAPEQLHCEYLPVGCDFAGYRPGGLERSPQYLFIGDLREPRKRFDRVLAAFELVLRARPDARLIVAGNKSESIAHELPSGLRSHIELKGYVSESELRKLYAESAGLLLLSDYEAFGVPILESLACATPVFTTDQPTVRSVFESFRGTHFCPGDDADATAALILLHLGRGPATYAEALNDRPRLESLFDWESLAVRKRQAMSAAWFLKRGWK